MKATTTTTALLRALLWLGTSMRALGSEMRITSVDKFIQFKDNVNKGTNYSGTTVFLDSDLSLAGKSFEPIGTSSNYFCGTFDGQGHVISNLEMTSSSQCAGLFGYSKGLAIKNVILDSSCSITSSFSDSGDAFIGGIIGRCEAKNGPCTIENSVNMGSVTFSGNVNGDGYHLYLGGIAGGLYSSSDHSQTVKNCANYGVITHSGESEGSRIGGIIGHSYNSSSMIKSAYIYNCLNNGTITHNGTTSNGLCLGEIAGKTYYTTIENCVSGGKISLLTGATNKNYTGSIVGYVESYTNINYTYFTSDLSGYSKYGGGTPSELNTLSYDSTSFELDGTVSIGSYTATSLIDALNTYADYYTFRDYSHWLLNNEKNAVSFTINKNSPFALNSQIILLPSLANDGDMSFDGWYTDDGFTTPLTEYEVTSDTELYGRTCGHNVTVTLDANGGDELPLKEMTIGCDRVYGDLPTPTRIGYTFLGWFTGRTDGDKIESGDKVTILSNHTLYAHWSINNYTLIFVFGNGTEPEVRVLEFNETITYPKNVTREGYIFNVWSPKPDKMPANNTTITAQWIEIVPELVEIVFGKKDLKEKEIEEIIKEYAQGEFDIVKIEDDEIGETKVIVRFVDVERAKNFIETIEASSEATSKIKNVGFVNGPPSFSPAHHPMNLLCLI